MEAGKLRERVTIQAPREVRSTLGETTLEWADVATVWANVYPYSGRDILQAMQANVVITHKVYIRYRPGITPEHRILWREKVLEITAVMERPSAWGREDIAILEIMTRAKQ